MAGVGIDFSKQTSLYRSKERKQAFLKGFIFSLFIIAATLLAWMGVFLYKKKQENKVTDLQQEIQRERSGRDYEELAQMLDSSSRLNFVSKFTKKQKLWSALMHEIEGKMLPSIYLNALSSSSAFEIGGNSSTGNVGTGMSGASSQTTGVQNSVPVSVEAVSPSLSDISKFIVGLRKSEKVTSIYITGITLSERGVEFSADIQLSGDALDRELYNPKNIILEQ